MLLLLLLLHVAPSQYCSKYNTFKSKSISYDCTKNNAMNIEKSNIYFNQTKINQNVYHMVSIKQNRSYHNVEWEKRSKASLSTDSGILFPLLSYNQRRQHSHTYTQCTTSEQWQRENQMSKNKKWKYRDRTDNYSNNIIW